MLWKELSFTWFNIGWHVDSEGWDWKPIQPFGLTKMRCGARALRKRQPLRWFFMKWFPIDWFLYICFTGMTSNTEDLPKPMVMDQLLTKVPLPPPRTDICSFQTCVHFTSVWYHWLKEKKSEVKATIDPLEKIISWRSLKGVGGFVPLLLLALLMPDSKPKPEQVKILKDWGWFITCLGLGSQFHIRNSMKASSHRSGSMTAKRIWRGNAKTRRQDYNHFFILGWTYLINFGRPNWCFPLWTSTAEALIHSRPQQCF